MKEGGDIPWNLAHHPYPENLFNPRFWNDRTAKPNFDTPRITFRNIDQLVKFFKQKDWRYHDKMRDIALTEQGVNYEDNKPDAELAQAAAYAYAYNKIKDQVKDELNNAVDNFFDTFAKKSNEHTDTKIIMLIIMSRTTVRNAHS